MAIPKRRKMLLVRLAALIKNLEKHPDDFTLDKQLDRNIGALERIYSKHSATRSYRAARNAARQEAEPVAEPVEEEPAPEQVEVKSDG